MNAQCNNCRFWYDIFYIYGPEVEDEGIQGECRRHAPSPKHVPKITEKLINVQWPVVGGGGGACGDWQLREEN
jgi:hypothetical protein